MTDAATLLGITPQAVRKRIAAGHLDAHKIDGAWQIKFERATDETDETATAQPRAQPGSATSQLIAQAEADRYAAIVAPHIARIEELSRQLGRLETQLAAVTAERDTLMATVAAPERAEASQPHAPVESATQDWSALPWDAGSPAAAPDAFSIEETQEQTGSFWRSWAWWKRRHP